MEPGDLFGVVIGTIAFGVLMVLLVHWLRRRQQRMWEQRARARAAYAHLVKVHAALFGTHEITVADVAAWRAQYPDAEHQATSLPWCQWLLPADKADATARAADLRDLGQAIQQHNARLAARRAGFDSPGTPPISPPKREPYRLNYNCLTAGEARFFRVLQQASPTGVLLWPKLRLGDLFWVPPYAIAARRRIDSKHVDFVIADAQTLRPLCGIELDDRSHQRPDRQARDQFVETVFATARLPLVRVQVRAHYDATALRAQLRAVVDAATTGMDTPTCPTCQSPMVRRTTKRGAYAGHAFYGCSRYPQCTAMVPVAPADAGSAVE